MREMYGRSLRVARVDEVHAVADHDLNTVVLRFLEFLFRASIEVALCSPGLEVRDEGAPSLLGQSETRPVGVRRVPDHDEVVDAADLNTPTIRAVRACAPPP